MGNMKQVKKNNFKPLSSTRKREKTRENASMCGSYTRKNTKARKDSEQQLRVLIYTACYNVIDGVTLTIRKIESAILDGGGHVCILTTRSGNERNTNLEGEHPNRRVVFVDDAVQLPFTEGGKNSDQTYYLGMSMSRSVMFELEKFRASVVHLTVPDCVGLQVIEFARQHEIPLMGTYHSNIVDYMDHYGASWVKPLLSAFFRHNYNFLQALYVPTPFMKDSLTAFPQRLHHSTHLRVWGRGVDLHRFHPNNRSPSFRESLGILPSEVVLCFVGRLVHEKRPDIFANVIRRLHALHLPFKALVIGAGQYESEMRQLPNTICTGWITDHHRLSVAYASSDIFFFPGALETFGNVTLEASASGLPLVVESNCSGHLVVNNHSGFACPAGDEDAFFHAVHTLIHNNEKRKQFAVNSRKHSLRYDKTRIMNQMLKNYTFTMQEFHTKYGGSHTFRDLIWKKRRSGAFAMGRIARPMTLRVFMIFLKIFMKSLNLFQSLSRLFLHCAKCLKTRCQTLKIRTKQIMIRDDLDIAFLYDIESLIPSSNDDDTQSEFIPKQMSFSCLEKQQRSKSAAPKQSLTFILVFFQILANLMQFNFRMQAFAESTISSFFLSSSASRPKSKLRKI